VEGRERLATFIPKESFLAAFEFDEPENQIIDSIITHAIWGLSSKNLIEAPLGYGEKEELQNILSDPPGPGMYFQPSGLGIELYLWAHSLADTVVAESIEVMAGIDLISDIPINLNGAQINVH